MASVRLAERAPLRAPSHLPDNLDYSITEVSIVLQDLSWLSTDGCNNDCHKLENEVMVDPWSSMDSSNSPLTDSGPSASDDCTPSTSSDLPRGPLNASTPLSPDACRLPPGYRDPKTDPAKSSDKARTRDLRLDLDPLESDHRPRRPHFLDDDYQPPSKSNLECRIPKPHFLDSPSPDELDERSDITNPNFLDDEIDGDDNAQKKAGALPKKPQKPSYATQEDRPFRTDYRSALQYRLENAARSTERDKRASQLYTGTWPGDRDVWTSHDTASVRSFSSNGSGDGNRPSSNLENKMECVCSLISLLTLSPENNADLSGPLLEMSRSVESCVAMRQAGCIPLLVQLIHSKVPRETRDRAAKALRNIIHTQTDDKAGRREARVWRLLEQIREYCYMLEDLVEARKEGKDVTEDDTSKHPSQSVAALMKLSFDEEHRHVVCQLGGLQALAALVSGDQAAHGSRTDDNTCLTMRKYAGMTLTNLTFGDGNNKSLLCSFKDFMLALVEQLESPNDDMRQVTAAVLRNLSWRADTNSKQVLREVCAVKGLTKAAMTCQKEATLKSVLSALWNLTAHCSMNKVALCSVDGALGFLVDMLSYDSPTKTLAIVENAGGIMRNVSSHIAVREDYRQILRERNCLSVLLQHLKSPSLTVVSNSCGTLWNLSARCPQDQQFLWDNGAVPMLRSLIHSKHKMIAMGSGAALKNLLNSKPGKSHIIALDTTARNMNLPALPTLGVRKQKALEQELDQNLAETCDNIEPATSPSTSNREEKNLFTATERHIAMNLERHRMTSSSPLMGTLTSQISLSHSAHLASYLSCSNTLLKGALVSRSTGSTNNVNRSDSKDSVTSTHSDSVFERVMRTGKVPVPTPRNKDLMKIEPISEVRKVSEKPPLMRYPSQPPIPPPRRDITDIRPSFTESGYDVDQDSCDQPVDYSQKYSETKSSESIPPLKSKLEGPKKYGKKENTFGDYQETDLDQPTDYSLRYAEHQSENGSDTSEPPGPSLNEDTIKHFATEGTPYETPIIFSTATSMSDLRVIGKDGKPKTTPNIKENPEVMSHSDEKDTCSIEDPPGHDNDRAISEPSTVTSPQHKRGVFDTKFSSGMISPEKPVNYCDEGTPGYFSRVSSLSSLEATEEDNLAKKNAMATINVELSSQEQSAGSSAKDKEGSKAVTFTEPLSTTSPGTPGVSSVRTSSPKFIEDTPLMFSRSSSLGSLPDCEQNEDQGSVVSEVSRITSGCISPSELPDSPGQSAPLSPRRPPRPATPPQAPPARSVFDDALGFVARHSPALSAATSLSSLTIDDEPKQRLRLISKAPHDSPQLETISQENDNISQLSSSSQNDAPKGTQTPCDTTRVYFTEDTPAILSKAGSNSNLSALSILSAISDVEDENVDNNTEFQTNDDEFRPNDDEFRPSDGSFRPSDPSFRQSDGSFRPSDASFRTNDTERERDSSDSSNLSDAGDLLEECIQKGIAKVVKNKAPTEAAINPFTRDDVYRSLPPYLRSSTETVKMSREYRNELERVDDGAPPPRPPKNISCVATTGSKHDSRPATTSQDKKLSELLRTDSLSSLSLDSFGSTDREIFEQTVNAGLSTVNAQKHDKGKAHSVERPAENTKHYRQHKSLDRSDKIQRHKVRETDFDRNIARSKPRKDDSAMTRSPFSYHGEAAAALAHHSRHRHRHQDDGPPSLPSRIEDRRLDRSNSLSSLSNESFGSTDKEVFERCVKMGMSKTSKKREEKQRGRSDDRLEGRESRRRRRNNTLGALEKMVADEDRGDRALLEEVIARGANTRTKNLPRGGDMPARGDNDNPEPNGPNLDENSPNLDEKSPNLEENSQIDAGISAKHTQLSASNECLAPKSLNTTFESETKDELNRSNESYADVLEDNSWSDDSHRNYDAGTLTRKNKHTLEYTDIKYTEKQAEDSMKRSVDTWNDNTCPDDVTFPTISGSVHMVASIKSEVVDPGMALPDLLEKSEAPSISLSKPDLTDKLEPFNIPAVPIIDDEKLECDRMLLDNIPEPSYHSLIDDGEQRLDSLMSSAIEKEAARLAAQLKCSQYTMENSVTSLTSLDLDHVKPPSNLGSLLSLSASGQWDEPSQTSKKSQKSRKKSLPVALMVKRALSNSMHQGSSEHLDSNPVSFLDNVKPPSELENVDMDSSMISVSSIVSEVAEARKTPITFDFKLPIHDFPLCSTFTSIYHDLDKVNPPSLFDEIAESTLDMETVQQVTEDNTLVVVTDIPSGSETCTPLPSDISSVESTPKKQRDPNYLTPKEKRYVAKDRYQTYTITDTVSEDDVILQVETQDFMTWTKSESDRSDEYTTASNETKSRRKLSAKQRRIEDRARYQTQTVDIHNIIQESSQPQSDPHIESLKRRLAEKKTIKQKRMEDAERFRTRTLSEDIPPSPTYVRDTNFENVETTTGYDSLSSNELNHQLLSDDRQLNDDVFSTTADSGHNEDDFELNSTQMQTYTRSFRNYLPVIESPAAVDMCVVNNLKNIEMTASFKCSTSQNDKTQNPSSSDFASYECDSNSEDKAASETESESSKPKPKIIKPEVRRQQSLDSNDSREMDDAPKAIRGRKKAYVSPYRRNTPATPKPAIAAVKPTPKSAPTKTPAKPNTSAKSTNRTSLAMKSASANTSPKKSIPNKLPTKLGQIKPLSLPLSNTAKKILPLERQGTFTKEESSVPTRDLPKPDKSAVPKLKKATTPTNSKPGINTSPSRLPQFNRNSKPTTSQNKAPVSRTVTKRPEPKMKSSASSHSLQSNDSAKTVTLASRSSRQGSTSSVNSIPSSKTNTKDVESRIANLWKKVEQNKKQSTKPDKRVWIESEKPEPAKLIRSSTFEGQPKQSAPSTAPKQKTAIGIRVSQIPSLRPKTVPSKVGQSSTAKKPTNTKVFARKPVSGQVTS